MGVDKMGVGEMGLTQHCTCILLYFWWEELQGEENCIWRLWPAVDVVEDVQDDKSPAWHANYNPILASG